MESVGVEAVESYRNALEAKDVYLTDAQIMDELAADYTRKIISSPEEMQSFVDEMLSGKDYTSNRNVLQRLFDSIKEFIKRISDKFSGRKAEQNQAAREAYGTDFETLKQAKNLLQKALKESHDIVSGEAANSLNAEQESTRRNSVKGVDGASILEYTEIEVDNAVHQNNGTDKLRFSSQGLRLSKAEYARLSRVIGSDYYNSNKTHIGLQYQSVVGTKEHILYVYEDYGFDDYKVVGRIDYVNEETANKAMEMIDSGRINQFSEFVGGLSKWLETRQSSYSVYNADTKERRRSGGVWTLSSEQSQSNAGGTNGGGGQNANYSGKNGEGVSFDGKSGREVESRKNSVKLDRDILAENTLLKKINSELNQKLYRLKDSDKKADKKRIAAVAREIRDNFDFAYNEEWFGKQLTILSDEAVNLDAETFDKRVHELARAVIDEGTNHDSLEYTESKSLRDYLRTTRITVSEEARKNTTHRQLQAKGNNRTYDNKTACRIA